MSRTDSFFIIALIYLFTFLCGFFLFQFLNLNSLILKFIIMDIVATIVVWIFSLLFKNSSIYDPYWSVAPLVIIPFFIKTFDFKTTLIIYIIFIWGIRLTINWAFTFKGLKYQDWRYTTLKAEHPKLWILINLFGIHLFPTIVVIGVMLPAFFFLTSSSPINLITVVGILISVCGIFFETVSDLQIHGFKKKNPGKVIQNGLWKYSRHPNYLGEILMWWGIYVMMLSVSPSHYLYFLGPLLNTFLFLFISIPMMEKRQLKNKPEYYSYRLRTSMLIPLPPKKNVEN